jgi:predicted acetyltransferase
MITFSAKESEVLGVRIARGVLNQDWQPSQLLQATLSGGYDFLRLKLPSNDEQVFAKLDSLGMHYCLHSILVRNSVDITAAHNFLYRDLRVEFELFDGSNEAAMKQLVKDSWGARTAVNYHNPNFRHWVTYEQEMQGSAAYACEFNYTINPTMPNWIVKLQGKPIGFVLGKVSEEGFEGIMYSIVPEFRGHNYAEDIMLFLKKWCFQQGIARFYNDVVFQNMPSLKSIVTESIVPVETYLNITISSLLNATKSEPTQLKISWADGNASLLNLVATYAFNWEKPGSKLQRIECTMTNEQLNKITSIRISEPLHENDKHSVLLLAFNLEVAIGAIYLRYLVS